MEDEIECGVDKKTTVKLSNIKVGDQVLLKQTKVNKFSTPYEVEPYTVNEVKGSQITASN